MHNVNTLPEGSARAYRTIMKTRDLNSMLIYFCMIIFFVWLMINLKKM